MTDLTTLEQESRAHLAACTDEAALKAWNSQYLGKNGALTQALKEVGGLPHAERPAFGQRVNQINAWLTEAYEQKKKEVAQQELLKSLTHDVVDVTLPGRPVMQGRLHLATQTMRMILAIFADMGFQVYRSREVEDDLSNFELLNMPPHHPARDMWDTFHTTTPGLLLRTHTSPGQIHAMRQHAPEPLRVVLPGMCYRYEQITTRSEIQFEQVEALAIGTGITMADLKGLITSFANRIFGQADRQIRIRSSYFPFTEPSIEVDVNCILCAGAGCSLCKRTGWLEIMGAGMMHPTVLRNGGYDPAKHSGFALGMGPQRIAILRHGLNDIRQFWKNDLAFVEQF